MTLKEFKKILGKYKDGTGTESENELVNGWFDNLSAREQNVLPNDEAEIKFQEKIKKVIGFDESLRTKRVSLRIAVSCAAAAAVLAAFGVYYAANFGKGKSTELPKKTALHSEEIVNNSSLTETFRLADGSVVNLSPKSKLTHLSFTASERRMGLEGTAFFKAARDPKRPFIIVTEKLITRVLGTSFLINAEKGKVESVKVKTGRVAVYQRKSADISRLPDTFVSITPNYQVHFDSLQKRLITSIVKRPSLLPPVEPSSPNDLSPAARASYRVMKFDETPAAEVLHSLEKAYGIEISYKHDGVADCEITISLQEEDLFTRLRAVCLLIGGSYRVEGTKIVLESTGCEDTKSKPNSHANE